MVTHDKSIYCRYCRALSKIKQTWYGSRCRDCQSWGSSWYYFLLFKLMMEREDDRRSIEHLQAKVNSLLRWVVTDLKSAIRDPTANNLDETFLKVLYLADR